jgi:hypothetical protein
MFYLKKINSTIFLVVLISLVLADFQDKNSNFLIKIDKSFYEEEPVLAKVIKQDKDPYRVYSGKIGQRPSRFFFPNAPTRYAGFLAGKEHMHPYHGLIYGVEYPFGLPSLGIGFADSMIWTLHFMRATPEKRLRILERSNVKYWVDGDTPTPFENGVPKILPDRLRIFNRPLPRAFMVSKAIQLDANKILEVYYSDSHDPLASVLLGEPVKHAESQDFDGKVESIEYAPNRVTVRTRQQGAGFLVLLDNYFPGWVVKVDGNEEKIFRANHFYRAVQLDSGNHTLEFEYIPEGYRAGLLISLITILALVGSLLVRLRQEKKQA